jgi:NADH:ubiquinone oxidoreductase subunit 4 (subunit M)
MEIKLLILLLIPLTGTLIQAVSTKIHKKMSVFFPIFLSSVILIYTIILSYYFKQETAITQFRYFVPWIPDWSINFILELDGINLIGLILSSLVCLVAVGFASLNKAKNTYYVIIFILQTLIIGFFLSYDLLVKIILWEMLCIPVFVLLSINEKNRIAFSFSKQWFFSEALLLTSLIILFNQYGPALTVENILSSSITGNTSMILPFILMLVAVFIRINLFPFDKISKSIIKTFEPHNSILITILLPMVPIFFVITLMYPLFADLFESNINYIVYFTLIGIVISLVRLFINKSINTITTSQLLIFNSLIFIWAIRPNILLISALSEIILVKTLLNLIILYFGYQIYKSRYEPSKTSIWMFSVPVFLSFGIPGLLMARPMFLLLSSWYSDFPYISILIIILLSLTFIYTCINIAPLLMLKNENKKLNAQTFISIIVAGVLIIFSSALSLYPHKAHKLSEAYYKYYTENKVQ